MLPRPPRSTLFPYTTLFRSVDHTTQNSPYDNISASNNLCSRVDIAQYDDIAAMMNGLGDVNRSEEHTSELQSHSDLVCRLLLEKKKKCGRPTAGITAASAWK